MSQHLLMFQSMWAMERRHTAGFDGVSTDYTDRNDVRRLAALRKAHGLYAEGQCFPRTVDDLQPVL